MRHFLNSFRFELIHFSYFQPLEQMSCVDVISIPIDMLGAIYQFKTIIFHSGHTLHRQESSRVST